MPRSLTTLALCLLGFLTVTCAAISIVQSQEAEKKEAEAGKKEPEKADGEAELKQAPRVVDRRQYRIGELIEDVAFADIEGKPGKLSDYAGSVLCVFVSNTTCPVSKRYVPTIAELQKTWGEKGVKFLMVNFTEGETSEAVKKQLEAAKLACRYALDPKAALGKALRATSTADCFLLDGTRTLRYRGAIDDQYGLGYMLDAPRNNYLKLALDALHAGVDPLITATWAPG